MSLRLLHFASAAFALLCLLSWLEFGGWRGFSTWVPVLAFALFYLVGPEVIAFNLSRHTSLGFLAAAMPVVGWLSVLVLPLVYPLERWHLIMRRYRANMEEDDDKATVEDEIRSLLEEDEEKTESGEELESDERRMIRNIFELDETLVREIMTPRIDLDAVPETITLAEVKARILASGHSRIPVYRKSVDHVAGLLYAKDLIRDELNRELPLTAYKELMHTPIFIPETKNVGDLLAEFQQKRSHFAVVIDEYGGTEGVVTLEDVLEEIVGEIHDEYDREEGDVQIPETASDGTLEVDGRASIYDLNERLDLNLPEDEDYDTIGGFVSARLGRIPRPGEVVREQGIVIAVVEADRRRVLRARITPEARQQELSS